MASKALQGSFKGLKRTSRAGASIGVGDFKGFNGTFRKASTPQNPAFGQAGSGRRGFRGHMGVPLVPPMPVLGLLRM